MKEIFIKASSRKYSIFLGENILGNLPELIESNLTTKKAFIVTDDHVFDLYRGDLKKIFKTSTLNTFFYSLPRGEKTKSNNFVQELYQWLIENRCDRHSVIIAFGGGVIGDLVGFVAATFLRGIPFIQIPTTLLSMVDSSIGGKVGINHKLGKNLIGAFYPPHLVLQDISVLKTLDKREVGAGLAECIKHALISSKKLFDWTIRNHSEIHKLESDKILELIESNLLVKADIVEKDEKEENIRAYLNFGHTFGHAIEKEFGYSNKILHGEAVALGTIAALRLSELVLDLNKEILTSTRKLMEGLSLPTKANLPSFENIFDAMTRDKKNKAGAIHFVLLNDIGSPKIVNNVSEDNLRESYNLIKD